VLKKGTNKNLSAIDLPYLLQAQALPQVSNETPSLPTMEATTGQYS